MQSIAKQLMLTTIGFLRPNVAPKNGPQKEEDEKWHDEHEFKGQIDLIIFIGCYVVVSGAKIIFIVVQRSRVFGRWGWKIINANQLNEQK